MKKLFVITLLTVAIFACSRKTTPTSEIIISNQEKKQGDKDAETTTVHTNTTEAGAGQAVYTTRCGRCHGLKPVEKYTAQQWENILRSMIPKAGLNETQSKQVTTYVMEHAKK